MYKVTDLARYLSGHFWYWWPPMAVMVIFAPSPYSSVAGVVGSIAFFALLLGVAEEMLIRREHHHGQNSKR